MAIDRFPGRFCTLAAIPAHASDRQVPETAGMSRAPEVGTGTFRETLDKITADAPRSAAMTIENAVQDPGLSLRPAHCTS